MKILVVTQYYHPEPGAPSNRLKALVEAMLERGHEVTVICEFPNYPSGRLAAEDKWRLFRIERHGSLKIIRTFVLTFARKNNIRRMLFYLSFALSSFVGALLLKRRDVILASSPPIFHVYLATFAARLKGSKLVVDIRDLWPDSALEVEAVTSSRLLRWGGVIEGQLYRAADSIMCISRGMKEIIEGRGGKGRISVLYNGSNEDMLQEYKGRDSLRRSLGLEDKLVIAYTGIIGLGQNLSALVPEIAGANCENTLFLIIGEGPGRDPLMAEIGRLHLDNMVVMDFMPRERVIAYTHAADVMLVVLRESKLFRSAIPSKFFDSMAAGKPVLSNVDGELRDMMERHNTGLYFSLKNKGSFSGAVKRLYKNPEQRAIMGENGRKLVEQSFLRKKLCAKAVGEIESLSVH